MGISSGDGQAFRDRNWKSRYTYFAFQLGWPDREAEVAAWLINDSEPTDAEIAALLGISVPTVRQYTTNLRARLKARGRRGLV